MIAKKTRKFPDGAAKVLRHYFEHGKLYAASQGAAWLGDTRLGATRERYYPTALQKQILANETVRHCLCLFVNCSQFQTPFEPHLH